jgi:hypothetical protein
VVNAGLMLAQAGGGDMLHYIIVVVVVLGAIAIAYIATSAMGIEIPQWLVRIAVVVVIVVVAIIAIKFVWTMM